MKHFTKLCTASLLLAFSGFAHAGLITITDEYKPETKISVGITSPYKFWHDFTDTGYTPGFDTIESASLTFKLKDNGKDDGGSETFTLSFTASGDKLFSGSNVPNGNTPYGSFAIVGAPLASLSADGKLQFTLSAGSGEFEFVSSTLSADYKPGVVPVDVPEPFSVALVGIGLAAIGAARRRKA